MTKFNESCGIAMPPEMPNELPTLIGLLTKNVPQYCKPAVAATMSPLCVAGCTESTSFLMTIPEISVKQTNTFINSDSPVKSVAVCCSCCS